MAKDTVEGHYSIDVRYLNREGVLWPGRYSTLNWSRGDRQTGSIGIRTAHDTITLIYSHSQYGREPEQVEQTISLTWTPAHFGGERAWFICGNCGGRVAILYGAGKYFACRKCYDLTYTSCQESDSRFNRWLASGGGFASFKNMPIYALKGLLDREMKEERRLEKAMETRQARRKKKGVG